MNLGSRVLIPASFGIPQDWVEMRLVGEYPQCSMQAVIYRLFEIYEEKPNYLAQPNPVLGVFRAMLDDEEVNFVADNSLDSFKNFKYLYQVLGQLSRSVLNGEYFDYQQIPPRFSSWGIKLVFPYYSSVIGEDSAVEVGLHVASNRIFVLYRQYSMESFLELPCGDLALKYECFAQMAGFAPNTAVSERGVGELQLHCPRQHAFPATFILQTALETGQSPLAASCEGDTCFVCGHFSKRYFKCRDSHQVCDNCSIKNFLTANFEYRACCCASLPQQCWQEIKKAINDSNYLLSLLMRLPQSTWSCTYREDFSASGSRARLRRKQGLSDSQVAAEAESVSAERSDFEERKARQVFQPPSALLGEDVVASEVQKECRTCKTSYTPHDKAWQCSSLCECKLCISAKVVGNLARICEYCSENYSELILKEIQKQYTQCHVCSLAVGLDGLVWGANCKVCRACVEILSSGSSVKIACIVCKAETDLDPEIGEDIKRYQFTLKKKACCDFDGSRPSRALACSHLVCARHEKVLSRCRVCRKWAHACE